MKFLEPIKEFFGKKNELITSLDIALEERITSPFYGYFIISWLIINWKIVYIAFFVSQDKLFEKEAVLRNEYLLKEFPPFLSIDHFWQFIILPFLVTILFFWIFPFLTKEFYRKSLKNQKELKRIELQENLHIKKEEKKLIQEETKLLDESIRKAKQEKKAQIETPELLWEKEFTNFRKSILFRKFDQILDSIYKYDGKIRANNEFSNRVYGYDFEVEKDILIYSDTNGLIKLSSGNIASFTDKGRFFAQRYSQIKGGVINNI